MNNTRRLLLTAPPLAAGAILLLIALVNRASLHDGLLYLRDMLSYNGEKVQAIDPQGEFGVCYDLIHRTSAERAALIRDHLQARGLPFQQIAISNSADIFVPFAPAGPYTIFSAHYDKLHDDPEYQGASDNTAAICVLLAAVDAFTSQAPARPTAILFTGEEELGLQGARAFVAEARRTGLQVAEVVNFDNVGRGGLGARASGERSGLAFTIPFFGDWVYDGREVLPGLPFREPDAALVARLNEVAPVTALNRMVAKSDGTFFEQSGWTAVTLTSDNMYFLDETWHTYRDRIELLDQRNLEQTLRLVVGYAAQPALLR